MTGEMGRWVRVRVRAAACGLAEAEGDPNDDHVQPLLPTRSVPIPTPPPSRRPGGAWGGAKLPQTAEGRAGWHSLGVPSQQRVVSPRPRQRGPPGTPLFHSPRPSFRGSLSDRPRSSPISFPRRAPPS